MAHNIPRADGCRVTKELFGPVVASPFNVHLDIFGPKFLAYADGYKLAGDIVVQNLRGSKQVLVFPVCYLYHQYLELMIKELTCLAGFVLKEQVDYKNVHDLNGLWQVCGPLLEKALPGYSNGGFIDVGKCVEAFAFDFEGDFSRFPEDKVRLQWQQSVEYMNLKKMYDAVANAEESLSSYCLELNSMLEHHAESASSKEV